MNREFFVVEFGSGEMGCEECFFAGLSELGKGNAEFAWWEGGL